ncbi:hypothetical protein GQ600_27739 [Phytophthora cactorum]|nr:hypothetical protein GQ600_27739 [Phytophthora cactorum]
MEEEMMMTQLPPQLHCRLSIKSGEPLTPACRDRLPGHDFAFMVADGYAKTLKEQLRENKREINRAVRQLDRERTNLQLQEKKLIIEIKKMAKQHITKFYTMRSQLQAVSLRLETAKSAEAMTSALQAPPRP